MLCSAKSTGGKKEGDAEIQFSLPRPNYNFRYQKKKKKYKYIKDKKLVSGRVATVTQVS